MVNFNPSGTFIPGDDFHMEARLIEETNERPDPELDDERRRYCGLTAFGWQVLTAAAARKEK
jgi:hypothetical protein